MTTHHEWNVLHEFALAELSLEWARVTVAVHGATGFHALEDVCAWGMAEARRAPILRGGMACGETIEMRLVSSSTGGR